MRGKKKSDIARSDPISISTGQVEEHLNKLAIEWLIEKFRELPDSSKENFLEVAKQILEGEHSKKL